ncbi:hypothetical protein ACFLWN_00780 [Chloroflexota bacterium]
MKHNEEETDKEHPVTKWCVDLTWYKDNQRSFSTLSRRYLCPACAPKFADAGVEAPPKQILSAIQSCCFQNTDFITEYSPILESIFYIFLANGNKSLALTEIGEQLGERRGGDTYHSAPEMLDRLLRNDQYYGFVEVAD